MKRITKYVVSLMIAIFLVLGVVWNLSEAVTFGSLEEIKLNPALSNLIQKNIFERLVFLDPKMKGNIEKVYALNKMTGDYFLI